MTENNPLLRAALAYAKRLGWPVFPLSPGTRVPPQGTHSTKDATTDPDTLRGWWARWPAAKLGLACGAAGLEVIDVDVKAVDGLEIGRRLKARLGLDSEPVMSRTPSEGCHLLNRAGGADKGNSAGRLGPGVEVRRRGGYIVLPPSRLESGAGWPWDPGRQPNEVQVAELPAGLLRLLAAGERRPTKAPALTTRNGAAYAQAALESELGKLAVAKEGSRNDSLNAAADSLGQLVGAGLPDRENVAARLEAVALAIGREPAEVRWPVPGPSGSPGTGRPAEAHEAGS